MKVLYLCHGKKHIQLEHSKYATTIDGDVRCNPDIVLDLIKDLNLFDKIIENNTYDLIEMRFPFYRVIINNDILINLCYKKLKLGGKLHINNLKYFILRDNYIIKYINSIIPTNLDYKDRTDKKIFISNMKFKKINYINLIEKYLKNINFKIYTYDKPLKSHSYCLIINNQPYKFNEEGNGISFFK